MRSVFLAGSTVLEKRSYRLWFVAFSLAALVLFILVPVWSVPGNVLTFQLTLFTFGNWILFIILGLLIGLLSTMQVFIFKRTKKSTAKTTKFGSMASGAAGAYSGILGGVFATAACSWCVAALFGFLGTGSVLLIARNQVWAVLVAVSIMLLSLYFASQTIVRECEDCRVSELS